MTFKLPEAWTKASELASAYDVGRAESQAALCLMNSVDSAVVNSLSNLVRTEGFRFVMHLLSK